MLYALTYLAVAVFVVAVAVRVIVLFRMPMHLRWELYPVPHEGGKRATYGGSYFESTDWWTKPRHFSLISMLRYMLPEMLLLKTLWEENRKLWYRSAPFHWGLYALAGLAASLVLGAVAQIAGMAVSADGPLVGLTLYYLTIAFGAVATVLGIAGAIAMLILRLTDEDLANYTAPREILNLVFILLGFASLGVAFAASDRSFSILRGYVQNLITFKTAAVGCWMVATEIVILSVLLAYIPLTHMSHFFVKWFTYHEIRWEDTPNLPGSKIESRIQVAVSYPVSWSAPHLAADGRRSWVDIATEEVPSDAEGD